MKETIKLNIVTPEYVWTGILKGEGWESRRFIFAVYCIFVFVFWKQPSLMFHVSYQNGGKILSAENLPEGEDDSGVNGAFFKTNYWWIKKNLAQMQSIK